MRAESTLLAEGTAMVSPRSPPLEASGVACRDVHQDNRRRSRRSLAQGRVRFMAGVGCKEGAFASAICPMANHRLQGFHPKSECPAAFDALLMPLGCVRIRRGACPPSPAHLIIVTSRCFFPANSSSLHPPHRLATHYC